MIVSSKSPAVQTARLFIKAIFIFFKTVTVLLLVLVAVLVASQSAVAPVSARLLGVYALEYSAKAIKPYRHYFPQPYSVESKLAQEEVKEEPYVRH